MRHVFGRSGWRAWLPLIGLLPAAILYGAFALYPSVMTGVYSFTNFTGVVGAHLQFVGWTNYLSALASGAQGAMGAVQTTVRFAVAVTLVQNALGVALAVLLSAPLRGRSVFRALIFLPQVFSVVITGLLWSLLFDPAVGPMETIWQGLFHQTSAFFGSYAAALPLVIAAQIWQNLGFTMVVYIAGLQTIPIEVHEAAALDGAHGWRRFRWVTLPLLAPAVTVNVLLALIGSLNTYDLIYVLTDGNFGTSTLGMYMFNSAFGSASANLGYASTVAMLQFVVTLVVVVLMQWYLRRREVQL